MSPTPVIDMFSGTGQLGSAVAEALDEAAQPATFSDTYGPARKYLRRRFPEAQVARDFRHQDVPEGSVVTIGVGGQDLSVARRHAGADRGSGTRSGLFHDALGMAVAGGAALIVAEDTPGSYRTYLDLARWLEAEHGYHATVSSAGAWEVGAPHRRERIMLVAARRHFEPRLIGVVRQVEPRRMAPTPTASSSTGPGRPGRTSGTNLQTWAHEGNSLHPLSRTLWTRCTGLPAPPLKDDKGRLNAGYVEWLMGLPTDNAAGLSRTARIRLAGNAVVTLQARLMLQRGLTAANAERNLR